ncbi:MAG: VanW family protein [Lachnospiraceae bacterium]|nr:VanW family protein [Lachnospiraceae bacterium]
MGGGKKGIVLGLIAVVAIVAGTFGYIKYKDIQNEKRIQKLLDVDTIYDGITVNGQPVGGLSTDNAISKLQESLNNPILANEIIISHGEVEKTVKFSDIDAQYDVEDAAFTAYQIARNGDIENRYSVYQTLEESGMDINANFVYDDKKLDEILQEINSAVTVEVKDSQLKRENGKFVITDEVEGYKMNLDKTKADVVTLLEQAKGGKVTVTGDITKPIVKKEDNEKSTSLIGTFYTKYTGSESLGRNINLKVGCDHITGTVVRPGDVFSMNEALGDQTYENGYKDAAVIVNGKLEDGLAGGVCQITTTLYNAVVKAELDVVERRNHSLAVAYVPLGQDAAIAGNYTDFKFKNSTEYPIYVEAYLASGKLVTNIYGYEEHDAGRTVELEHVYVGSIAKPAEKVTEDPNLPLGERVVTYTGKVGHKITTYKKVYENGTLLSSEWFSDSTYKSTADEVSVGTGAAAKVSTTDDNKKAVTADSSQQTNAADEEITSPQNEPEQMDSIFGGSDSIIQ